MEIKELLALYARHPQVRALSHALSDDSVRTLHMTGLQGSAAALTFAAANMPGDVADARRAPLLFILDDAEEAGYFYHDLVQLLGEEQVLFFPSSFRRAVKFGQRDAANEILRTEVLARLTATGAASVAPMVVSYPEAVAERVVSKKTLDERTLQLRQGEHVDPSFVAETLMAFGFHRTDYVYEPGQFAVRGSLVDVFSYSSEYPFRIDFFGDGVDSIRTFEVETQLSRNRQEQVTLVPELGGQREDAVPLATLLPEQLVAVAKDMAFITERIGQVWNEGFSQQALIEEKSRNTAARLSSQTSTSQGGDGEGSSSGAALQLDKNKILIDAPTFEHGFAPFRRVEMHLHALQSATSPGGKRSGGSKPLSFSTTPQPIFHKNFDLLGETFLDYLSRGYTLYILADSQKQTDRLKAILEEKGPVPMNFIPVSKTLHAGFADNTLKVCLFTDHQIFDRFHKYNLRSERARSGKVALTLKELQEFEVGSQVWSVCRVVPGAPCRRASKSPTAQAMLSMSAYTRCIRYRSTRAVRASPRASAVWAPVHGSA